jgi:hypothetical protein
LFEGHIMDELDGEKPSVDLIGDLMLGHRDAARVEGRGAV